MVIHDPSREEAWASARVQSEEREKKEEKKKGSVWSVVVVQSVACAVVVLLALLLRWMDGTAYEQLRDGFYRGMMGNELLATLARWWDGDPLEDTSQPPQEDAVSSVGVGRLPPEGALAVGLRVNRPAVSPLAEGTIASGYGYRQNPTGEGEQFHRGVDIAAPAGTPIAAMYDGTVTEVGENDSLGWYLRLDHGAGVEILYAHCREILVAEGTVVRAGERVALVGSTGDSTGPHLHLQVSADGVVYHPAGFLPLSRYA